MVGSISGMPSVPDPQRSQESGNSIRQQMEQFIEQFYWGAWGDFNFSGNLVANNDGTFNGSASEAQAYVSREKNELNNDDEQIQKMINYIDSQLKNPNVSAKVKETLENDKNELITVQQQIQDLYSLLSSLRIQQGPNANTFTVSGPSGWQDNLGNDENAINNGIPYERPSGGLFNMLEQLQSEWG